MDGRAAAKFPQAGVRLVVQRESAIADFFEHFKIRNIRRSQEAKIEEGLDAPVETLDDERSWQPEVLDTRGAIGVTTRDRSVDPAC